MTADLLEGIDATSTREKLYAKVRELAQVIYKRDDAELAELQKIEERVAKRYARRTEDLIQVTSTYTADEADAVIDFLENWGDRLPLPLWKFWDTMRSARGKNPAPTEDVPF